MYDLLDRNLSNLTTFPRIPITLYTTFSIQLCGLALLPLCLFRLGANSFSGLVIIRRVFQSSIFKWYLMGLCVADTGTLVTSVLIICLPRVCEWANLSTSAFFACLVHLTPIAFGLYCSCCTMSAWMVVAVSVMRCLSLEFPFAMRVMTRYRTKALVLGVGVTSMMFNATRFWELQAAAFVDIVNGKNLTIVVVDATAMRRHPTYVMLYVTVFVTILNCFVPFTLIISTNILTSIRVYQTTKQRLQLGECLMKPTGGNRCSSTKNREPHLVLISMLLGAISFMFTLCNSVPFVGNCIEMAYMGATEKFYDLTNVLGDVGNFLICVNASLNFCIYIFFNEKCRRKMADKLRNTIPSTFTALPKAITNAGLYG